MSPRKPKPTPLGRYLKQLRLKKEVTLRDVEHATGISNAYLSQLETGARQTQKLPSANVLRRLADYFNVTMMEILHHTGYLEEEDVQETMEDKINKAYEYVRSRPEFKHGTRITGEPSLDMKRFIVEMYENTTKEKLL